MECEKLITFNNKFTGEIPKEVEELNCYKEF